MPRRGTFDWKGIQMIMKILGFLFGWMAFAKRREKIPPEVRAALNKIEMEGGNVHEMFEKAEVWYGK